MAPVKAHPLKRISTGSLSSLARSQDRSSSSPSGLDFLQPALTDLADEAATLASNIQNMTKLHDALGVFNESFAGYLYALKMNAFCVEWPEAPHEHSFARSSSLVPPPPAPEQTTLTPHLGQTGQQPTSAAAAADLTYATVYSSADQAELEPRPSSSRSGPVPGAGSKPALAGRGRVASGPSTGIRKPSGGRSVSGQGQKNSGTIAERKKREVAISDLILTLPIEFRGGEPQIRKTMEKVLTELMVHPEGRKILEIVSPPELPQAKVNKCLIALVNKKLVTKQTMGGVTLYKLK